MKRFIQGIGSITLLLSILVGCGSSESTEETASENGEQLTKVKQITNWFAQPDFGGLYAALEKGYYEEAGLHMTIESGGPQISEIQIVASGEAQFGMASGDEILVAREQGLPIVAIAALYQTDPQVLLYHKDEPIQDVNDLNGRTVYVASGAMYWEYLKNNYQLDNVKEMAFTGQFTSFINDKTSLSQAYMTTAPFLLEKQGVDVDYLLVKDSGYENYADVLFTTEKFLKENPDTVKAYVEATVKGWDYYQTNYEEINQNVISKENPDLEPDAMKFTSETLMDLVFGGDAADHGVGYMTKERWETLAQQLTDVGVLSEEINVDEVFTTEFLPNS